MVTFGLIASQGTFYRNATSGHDRIPEKQTLNAFSANFPRRA